VLTLIGDLRLSVDDDADRLLSHCWHIWYCTGKTLESVVPVNTTKLQNSSFHGHYPRPHD